jgi:cell division protein FtsX
MSDDKRIQLNDLISISADDWKQVQHQLAENKSRLDYYYGDAARRYHELHEVRKRVTAIESWKESLMFWLKFAAWSVVVVVAFFLISTAVFVFKNEDIRVQYINKIIKPLPGVGDAKPN